MAQEGTLLSGVAGRYAASLFDLARESGSVDKVGQDLETLNRLIDASPDLMRFIKSPVFGAEEQERAVKAVMDKAGIGGLASNFVRLVASNRRLFALPRMIAIYGQMLKREKGIVTAEVTVADKPSERALSEIKAALREVAKAEVDVNLKINPAIIGGLVVKIGSRMVDASLKTKLQSIHVAMKEAR